ncbi:2-C-methyl-D-erythritol 4-phosphate cytidylyltransferase [Granulosicoccus sp. 3-233]|uniref:2-C-methyl-D-erythritol 4-phosphate cytidylyltransferase n=1 Tax=Granulosicoccus sp. 3-233 TaxID=3417969 RepID=UPI003D355220
MNEDMWIVVPAAGRGERMGSSLPKQYITIGEHTMLQHTLTRLLAVKDVAGIVVTLAEGDEHWPSVAAGREARVHSTIGGMTRADSVIAGLRFVLNHAPASSWVLVHDAARPLVSVADIKRLTDAVRNSGAVGGLLASPVNDTLKRVDEYCCVELTVTRRNLWQAQTPQMFRAGELFEALQSGALSGAPADSITDESSAMEGMGHEPLLVEALQPNLKVTRPADLTLATLLLANLQSNS